MIYKTYSLSKDDDGRRIDRIVRRFLPDMPLSAIYRLLRKGLVRVDGRRVSPDFKAAEGSAVQIAEALVSSSSTDGADGESHARPGDADYREWVLLETPDLLFINKPEGIPVHGKGGLSELIPQSPSVRESLAFRTGPLHRLDLGTTGIIAFSRSLVGARWFSAAISGHEIGKLYLGLAEGLLPSETRWSDIDEDGKKMETIATAIATAPTPKPGSGVLTLVQFRILTGRKHQIRKQASSNGHPLAADRRYGGHGAGNFFLHAWKLMLPDSRPESLPAEITAPLPARFASRISELFGDNTLAHIEEGELYWGQNEEHQ